MNFSDIQSIEDRHMARVYSRKQVAIVRGSGATVYDSEGREYVDCAGGYGTCIVGHSHPRVVEAISRQAHELISCHASTYNDARAEFLQKLLSITPSGLDRAYLGNTGAEAVEFAIKVARKSTGRRIILAMKGGYHGKTHGALSATWDSKYRKNFEPLLPDFVHVPYGDVDAAKTAISRQTAAVIVEPVQGEGGVRVPPPDWLPLLRDLTRDTGALLVADEVQTGFGRTGRMFACEHFGVTPDVLCLGKGVASGLPVGIVVAGEEVMNSMSLGEHTSTFGGNPVVCASGSATIDVLLEEKLVENAKIVGSYFKEKLASLQKELRIVRDVRGFGLMVGVEMRFDILQILQGLLSTGVLALDAGRNVLRFLPPLCLSTKQVDQVIIALRRILEEEQVAKLAS
jgi:LysW-gamma-L-lysine/LysW-L-ornithine aminotransferase